MTARSTVTVLTAVLPRASDHLQQAWRSVATQELPVGWDLEWVVQVDGPGELAGPLPDDPRVRGAVTERRYGPAIARNLGLARARGSVVRVLDADDLLPAGALLRELTVLDTHPSVDWITSSAVDLLPDASIRAVDTDPDPGPLVAGSLAAYWRAHDYRLNVHPASLAVRIDACRAVGGWAALPTSEDTALLLTLDLLFNGWFLAAPGLVHRRWDAQTTARPSHTDPEREALRSAWIQARLHAVERRLHRHTTE